MVLILRRQTMLRPSQLLNRAIGMTRRMICALVTLSLASQGMAASIQVSCPVEIPASWVQIKGQASDWVPFVDEPAKLVGAGAASGPPGSYATLVGEPQATVGAAGQSVKYRFDREHLDAGNWIECIYGGQPEIALFKRLPDEVTECTIATRRRNKIDPPQAQIVCRK